MGAGNVVAPVESVGHAPREATVATLREIALGVRCTRDCFRVIGTGNRAGDPFPEHVTLRSVELRVGSWVRLDRGPSGA